MLLELLEVVPDAAQLERLLESANLLRILRAKGRSDDQIREDLGAKLPGELLLGVLREGASVEELLALCEPDAPARPAEPKRKKKSQARRISPYAPPVEPEEEEERRYPVTTPFQETMTLHKVAGVLFAMSVIFPAMSLANFFPAWKWLSPGGWIALGAAGAAATGALFVHKRAPYYVGVLGGLLCAPGALVAILVWTNGRTSVMRIELAIAFLLGALPGALVYMWLFRREVPAEPAA